MSKMIHSMIRVRDEAASIAFYETALGFSVRDRYAMDGFTLIYLRDAESTFELELTVNEGATEPYSPGNGYGHLAVSVEALDTEHARLDAAGFHPTACRTLAHQGVPLARFFFLTDPDGYRIEMLQRGDRYL